MGPAAAVGADREAAADHFAERGHVGANVVALLGATEGNAEAGHDFIEYQERAVAGGDFAEGFEVAGQRRDAAHVADDGLDNDGGDFGAAGAEGGLHGFGVVVGHSDGSVGEGFRDAAGVWDAEGGDAGAGLDEERIDVAVVAAFEFDD